MDWYAWACKQGKQIDTTSSHAIPFSELLETLEFQGMTREHVRQGDILIIRSGYLRQYADMDESKRHQLNELYKTHKPDNIGVEPSEELLEFPMEFQVCRSGRRFEVV